MRHGDDSVMEVSRTWSVAPGAVHRIYLGRTVTLKNLSVACLSLADPVFRRALT